MNNKYELCKLSIAKDINALCHIDKTYENYYAFFTC